MKILVAFLVAALPVAAASGEVVVGPATIALDNGQSGTACGWDPSGICPVGFSGTDLGSYDIDTAQNIRHARLIVNETWLPVDVSLLPDDALTIDSSDVYLKHPVFRILVENVGTVRGPGPLEDFGFILTEESWGVAYYGPPLLDPTGEFRRRANMHDFGNEGVGYDQLGPYGTQGGNTSTDTRINEVFYEACTETQLENCEETTGPTDAAIRSALPNAAVGFAIYQVGLADDAGDFAGATFRGDAAEMVPLSRSAPSRPPLLPTARDLPLSPLASGRSTDSSDVIQDGIPAKRAPIPVLAQALPGAYRPDTPTITPLIIGVSLTLAAILASLYSRFNTRDEALASERRSRIRQILEQQGARPISLLARELGIDRTTVDHHTRLMERMDLARRTRVGRTVYVHLPDQDLPADARAPGGASRTILDILRAHGGSISRVFLQEATRELPARTRNHALHDLVADGAIERAFVGNEEILRLRTAQG